MGFFLGLAFWGEALLWDRDEISEFCWLGVSSSEEIGLGSWWALTGDFFLEIVGLSFTGWACLGLAIGLKGDICGSSLVVASFLGFSGGFEVSDSSSISASSEFDWVSTCATRDPGLTQASLGCLSNSNRFLPGISLVL
jgi:hypothetical protein